MASSILIVDDSPPVRESLVRLFADGGFQVCGEADSGPAAIEKAQRLNPSLVVMDLSMPGMNGIETAVAIRERVGGGDGRVVETDHLVIVAQQLARENLDPYAAFGAGYQLEWKPDQIAQAAEDLVALGCRHRRPADQEARERVSPELLSPPNHLVRGGAGRKGAAGHHRQDGRRTGKRCRAADKRSAMHGCSRNIFVRRVHVRNFRLL